MQARPPGCIARMRINNRWVKLAGLVTGRGDEHAPTGQATFGIRRPFQSNDASGIVFQERSHSTSARSYDGDPCRKIFRWRAFIESDPATIRRPSETSREFDVGAERSHDFTS